MNQTLIMILYWQGARDLAKPPTLTEILQCTLEKAKSKSEEESPMEREDEYEDAEEGKRGLKRKFDPQECSEDQENDTKKEHLKSPKELGKLNKAKNVGIIFFIVQVI